MALQMSTWLGSVFRNLWFYFHQYGSCIESGFGLLAFGLNPVHNMSTVLGLGEVDINVWIFFFIGLQLLAC